MGIDNVICLLREEHRLDMFQGRLLSSLRLWPGIDARKAFQAGRDALRGQLLEVPGGAIQADSKIRLDLWGLGSDVAV